MKNGKDEYDQSLLDSLEKKYQLFIDSPNGEINVYLVLNKMDESKSEISSKNNMSSINMNMGMHMSSLPSHLGSSHPLHMGSYSSSNHLSPTHHQVVNNMTHANLSNANNGLIHNTHSHNYQNYQNMQNYNKHSPINVKNVLQPNKSYKNIQNSELI